MDAIFQEQHEPGVSIYNPKWLAKVRAKQRAEAKRKRKQEMEAARRKAIAEKIEDARKADAAIIAAKAEVERLQRKVAEQQHAIIRLEADRACSGHAPIRRRRRFTYAEIEARACLLFNCREVDIRGDRRSADVVLARQFVMYWSARLTSLSSAAIGRLMGRDHTTVLHGKRIYVEKRAVMGRSLRVAR